MKGIILTISPTFGSDFEFKLIRMAANRFQGHSGGILRPIGLASPRRLPECFPLDPQQVQEYARTMRKVLFILMVRLGER